MPKHKLIIFDCDGVLVDSEGITNTVLANYLNEFGLNFTPEKALQLFRGGALSDCIQYIKKEHDVELPDEFVSTFRHRMKASFEKDLQAVPGVKLLLESLENTKKCVASNGPLEKMDTTLKVTGLKEYFKENVFSAYQINKWKPDPALFLYAAEKMQVRPSDCVVVEDSPRGAEAARLAGMKCYGFGVYGQSQELEKQGAHVFTKMEDLIEKL